MTLRLTACGGYVPQAKGLQGFSLLLLNMGAATNELLAFLFMRTQELLAAPAADSLQLYDNLKAAILTKAWELYRSHRQGRLRVAHTAESSAAGLLHQLWQCDSAVQYPVLLQQAQQAAAATVTAWQARPRQVVATLDHMFGDRSSYYFHQQARAPHPPTIITALHRPGRSPGNPLDTADFSSPLQVGNGLQYACDFYSSASPFGLFRPRQDISADAQAALLSALPRQLSPHQAVLTEGIDSDSLLHAEELELALQMAARGSSPGHDGLPYEFYRAFRQVMLPVMLKVFNAAFQDVAADQPLARLLRGVICLILKPSQPPEELSSYRPITLLNCDAKLVMLVMSNRLQRPLDYVIDITQSAFLRGRDISDNIRYHVGLANRIQELGLPDWLLHSDLTKAYDSADRGWLSRCMTAMGLRADGIVRWCRILMAGSSACVRINGFLSTPFPTANGLPQGSALAAPSGCSSFSQRWPTSTSCSRRAASPGSRCRRASLLQPAWPLPTTPSPTSKTRNETRGR